MKIIRNYEYRLRMNRAFKARAEEVLEESRQFYNAALAHRIAAYKADKKTVTIYDQQFELTGLRSEFPEYAQTAYSIQREALDRVDKAYKAFFRRVKNGEKAGFPRFKGKDRYDSFAYHVDPRHNSPLQGDKLTVPSVGTVRVRLHRPLPADATIKQMRIVRRADGWYCMLSLEIDKEVPAPVNQAIVGLDVGIASFATLDTGEQIANPRFLEAAQAQLTARSRRLALKPKRRSKHRQVAKRLVAKSHLKIKRTRAHFHWNVARNLASRFGVIVIEDLNIKGMVKSNLARSISDVGWGNFALKLSCKAEDAGGLVVRVNPRNTSRTCPQCDCCDVLNRLTQAQFKCIACGYENHADIVGAINIRARGAEYLSNQGDNSAGGAARKKRAPVGAKRSRSSPCPDSTLL